MAARAGQVVLKKVRLSFPHLWEPTKSVEDGKLKYRGAFLMDPETKQGAANIAKINAAIKEAKAGKWKDKADKIKIKDDRMCLKDGDSCVGEESGEVYIGYAGMMAITTANSRQPQVVDCDKTPLTESSGRPYAGCYVNAVISIYAIADAAKGGNGIFATLEAVQFNSEGEAFGAAPVDIDDVFDDVSGEDEDDEV